MPFDEREAAFGDVVVEVKDGTGAALRLTCCPSSFVSFTLSPSPDVGSFFVSLRFHECASSTSDRCDCV